MKKRIWIAMTLLFAVLFAASSLNAGYKKDPWGSNTWTGPGRPPHWSPEATPKRTKPTPDISPKHRRYPDRSSGVTGKHRGKGGYWKDRHKRWHYHKYRRSGFIYYREPKVEKVIVEQQKSVVVYKPVLQRPSRQQCGGKTITRKDPETGTLTIEYVTGAQDCK